MTVLIVENVPVGFRGELTQWLLEVKAGVFVGNITAAVRAVLWKKVQENIAEGAAMIIYSAQTEQGFAMDVCNMPRRSVVDMEGIYLIRQIVDEEMNEG